MPSKTRKVPSYRLHRPTGQAVVRLDGRDHYLGKFDTPTSHERYHRLIAEWLSAGFTAHPSGPATPLVDVTVSQLVLAYWRHCQTYYRQPDGTAASELDNIKLALRSF